MNDERGSGRTTEQMQTAPKGAVYVWRNSYLDYPRQLACKLERNDLLVISPGAVERTLLGRRVTWVEVDHAASLDDKTHDLIRATNCHAPPNAEVSGAGRKLW